MPEGRAAHQEGSVAALGAAFAFAVAVTLFERHAGALSARAGSDSSSVPKPRLERMALPSEVPSLLRAAVARECVALVLPSGEVFRVWPARRVRAAALPEPGEPAFLRERVHASIEQGSLIAVASWESPWRDFHDQVISPGIYALIYAIQPAFKQHRGVSEFRDTVLVVQPADAIGDRDLARLVGASRGVSGTAHPAVAAVFPVDPDADLPRLTERSGGGLTLELQAGRFRLGLAVSGKGHLDAGEP